MAVSGRLGRRVFLPGISQADAVQRHLLSDFSRGRDGRSGNQPYGRLGAVEVPSGPWENSPYNPVVHTWIKTERYLSKGHGTVFDDATGRWFIVYHAYENGYLPLGRQTLIEPIVWTKDGWFRTVRNPKLEGEITVHPNAVVEPDDFSGKSLKLQWQLSGVESLDDVELADGVLTLPAFRTT